MCCGQKTGSKKEPSQPRRTQVNDAHSTRPLQTRGERTDSSIKRLPNGAGWRARPTLGTDPVTGKQVRPTKVFATKKAALDWVTEQRQHWSSSTWAPKSTRTFDEVADHWLNVREANPSIGPNTVRADRESLAYARRAFGAVQVQKLTPATLADWSAALKGKDGKALAPSTKRRAIIRLKSVMAHARKMRWITYDPSADLESPEQKSVTATNAVDIWTPKQMDAFLDHVVTHRLAGCFALTLLGLRREEVGGLRWRDIDLDTGALCIRRARVDVNGKDTIVPTKTDRSARDLPLPPRELAMIKAMRGVHLRERLAVGRPLTDDDLLLSRADGTWLPVREYSREFNAQRTAAGLKAIPLGKLRHSNISRMRAAGVAADVVAAWHGHTERMTQAVYGRVTDDRLTAAASIFTPAIGQN
jgi:integrase